jgi:hypothetical protein
MWVGVYAAEPVEDGDEGAEEGAGEEGRKGKGRELEVRLEGLEVRRR